MFDFASPVPLISRAFERIAGDLHVPGLFARMRVRGLLFAAFRDAHRSGDPRRERGDVAAVLAGHEWRWPFFERTTADLREQAAPPASWARLGVAIDQPWDAIAEATKIELLVITLICGSIAERDREKFMEMVRTKSLLPGWKQVLRSEEPNCPAEALMIKRHRKGVESRSDGAYLPPYFPYDGTHLRTHIPKRRR